jgi:hypothetical protein
MSWYKDAKNFQTLDDAFQAVRRSLNALHYTNPDFNVAEADIPELAEALTETGTVPVGVDPWRYATMVMWYSKHPEDRKLVY